MTTAFGETIDWEAVLGEAPLAIADTHYRERPSWIVGYISYADARFLFMRALEASTRVAVEIGTASGFSAGLLCRALAAVNRAGLIGDDFEVVTYDVTDRFYADSARAVGDAAREQLPPSLLKHITFRAPATALKLGERFDEGEVEFLFIDANHQHPWPTLDLLAALDYLGPSAEVILHDINLHLYDPKQARWGAKLLFDGVDAVKQVPDDEDMPNIGSITIPDDRESLRRQLWRIVFAHPWEADVSDDVIRALSPRKELRTNG